MASKRRQRGGRPGGPGLRAGHEMPEGDDGPANKRWRVGDLVLTRGGCVCRVKSVFSASYKEGRSGKLTKWWGWSLKCVQHGNTWVVGDRGDWSPIAGNRHDNDVLGPATNAALAVIGLTKADLGP